MPGNVLLEAKSGNFFVGRANSVLREFQKSAPILNAAPPGLVGPFARTMALVFNDQRRCANVSRGRMEEFLPCRIGRESATCAVGRGDVKFHQKSMDPHRENWRLSSMGWSEVVGEVSMDELIGRPRGDGGRFQPPLLVGVGCLLRLAFFCQYGKYHT